MKKAVILVAVGFVGALAIMVGKQMSADAMAVVVGIVCGIGASIPTSLLMLYLVSRRSEREEVAHPPAQHMPSVMIVNPSGGAIQPYYQPPANQYLPPLNSYGHRQFEILGAEEYEERGRRDF